MTLPAGLCESWTPVWTCALPTGAAAVTGTAVSAATEILYALSGRRFGLCTETVRPCRRECYGGGWPAGWVQYGYPSPALIRGRWYNLTCSGCAGDCSCSVLSEALLPGPVYDVTQVKVDGVILTEGADYRVDDYRLLVRLGGELWPTCNDLALPDTEVNTWSVTFRRGEPVPTLGGVALGVLAVELTNMLLCNKRCALPKQVMVQSISRQGVDVQFIDTSALLAAGRTGLYWPDQFISTYNPAGLRRRSQVYDVDDTITQRRIGTG